MDFLRNIPTPSGFQRPGELLWEQKLRNYPPLVAIFRRRYWRRMWIVQELRLARGWMLLCGQKQVDYNRIKQLCASPNQLWIRNKPVKAILELGSFRNSDLPNTIFREKDRLTTLFRMCKDQECEDPRDKIFALLGIVQDGGHGIAVDYSCSGLELYARVLTSTLKYEPRFAFNNTLVQDFERQLCWNLGLPRHDLKYRPRGRISWIGAWLYRISISTRERISLQQK